MNNVLYRNFAFLLLLTTASTTVYPPFFTSTWASKDVSEDIPIGTSIFELEARISSGRVVTIEPDPGTDTGQVVHVGTISGPSNTTKVGVYLKKKLDRETKSEYDLVFVARSAPGVPVSRKTIKLYINDVNDEHPKFSSLSYQIQVYENATVNDEIDAHIHATDSDNGLGGRIIYRLQPAGQGSNLYQGYFDIDPQNGKIILKKELNYEKLTFLQFKISAHDLGTPPLDSLENPELIVTVLDVQDSPPYFQSLPYMVTIFENTTRGSVIFYVIALDGDRGIPNQLEFVFGKGNCGSYLTINNTTGEITLQKSVDRDSGEIRSVSGVCVINVVAQEKTDHPQGVTRAETPLTVTILDVNDNAPTFSSSVYNASVEEGMSDIPLRISGGIHVEDRDQGENSIFELTVHHPNGLLHSGIVASPSKVYSGGNILLRLVNKFQFDHEVQWSDEVLLIATEKKTKERRSSSCTIIIQINDTNDNDPVFTRNVYEASIPENSPINTLVLRLQAVDPDSGENARISYVLRGSTKEFAVDPITGRLYVACTSCELDREKKDVYFMTVEAVDGGGRRTSASVVVNLTDVNDNAPQFQYKSYEVGIYENTTTFSTGENEYVLSASDRDLENTPNSELTFAIQPLSNGLHANFIINRTDGRVQMIKSLNYDNLPKHLNGKIILSVMVKDNGTPSLSATVSFIISFQKPSVTVCSCRKRTKQMPQIPKSFSLIEEITASNNGNGMETHATKFYKIWYSHELKLVRFDIDSKGTKTRPAESTSTVHDFNSGLAYETNRSSGTCQIKGISAKIFDVDIDEYHKIAMKTSLAVFDLDDDHANSYAYIGKKNVRGHTCDAFVGESSEFLSGLNATMEYCFSSNDIPVQLKVDVQEADHMSFIYSFYNFDRRAPEITDFDISSCYPPERIRNIKVTFIGPFGAVWKSQQKKLLLKSIYSVSSATSLSSILISNPNLKIEAYRRASFTASLLDNSPRVSRKDFAYGATLQDLMSVLQRKITDGNLEYDVAFNGHNFTFNAHDLKIINSFQQHLNFTAILNQSFNLCDGRNYVINCSNESIIRIVYAVYRGNDDSICRGSKPAPHVCLSRHTSLIIGSKCNTYKECNVVADTSELGDPCPGFDKYLQVSYQCIKHF